MAEARSPVIAALDIGSTKVVIAVAAVVDGKLDILGIGKAENRGVKQGQIINMAATQQAIQNARDEAELMSGTRITEVYLSVGGEGIRCVPSIGMVPVEHEIISELDIAHVLRVAKAIHLPEASQILHVVPLSYTVDGQVDITSPAGMHGVRLEVESQLVVVPEKTIQNLVSCVAKAGLKVKDKVLQQMASAEALVRQDEKDIGVAIVDIGGGTCDLICYRDGRLCAIGTIPVGGMNFTQDVAVGLKTPLLDAESLKIKYGAALADLIDKAEAIEIAGLGENKESTMTRGQLCKILEARAEETLSLIFQQLNDWDVIKDLGAGLVLTGGASQLKGLVELGEYTFDIPVRLGAPKLEATTKELHSNPVFTTAIGTLKLAVQSTQPAKLPSRAATVTNSWEKLKNLIGKTLSI